MKKVFVKTKNVKKLITLMSNLQNRSSGVPGMGLVYGEPGLGKTQAINWWAFKNDAVVVRCTQRMTHKWLLDEIISGLDEEPQPITSKAFNTIVSSLNMNPRTIIIDEIDYLSIDNQVIETLRDINDRTDTIIVMVGMAEANSRLKRFKHLYDRISEVVKFEMFSKEDLAEIVKELSEIEFTECAIKYICSKTRRFRQIVKIINKGELIAKSNGLTTVDEIMLKETINYETEDFEVSKKND